MKIVLVLPEFDSEWEKKEALEYVDNLKGLIGVKKRQGFPGALRECSYASIWVTDVEVID